MALPFDYELRVLNNNRAYWDVEQDGNLEVDVDSGGGAGEATVRARLVLPPLAGAALGSIGKYVNIIILPLGADGLSQDYTVADFAIDADGYFYFTIYNHTTGQAEEVGQFAVFVDRVTWA